MPCSIIKQESQLSQWDALMAYGASARNKLASKYSVPITAFNGVSHMQINAAVLKNSAWNRAS